MIIVLGCRYFYFQSQINNILLTIRTQTTCMILNPNDVSKCPPITSRIHEHWFIMWELAGMYVWVFCTN